MVRSIFLLLGRSVCALLTNVVVLCVTMLDDATHSTDLPSMYTPLGISAKYQMFKSHEQRFQQWLLSSRLYKELN
jgi:hypothetical protein